jgi:hypothetical protein
MKKTLIVHSPEARKDVERWLKKKKVTEKYKPVFEGLMDKFKNVWTGFVIEVYLGDEQILIIQKSELTKMRLYNKLVLYGQFTETDLANLNRYCCSLD